MKVAFAVVTSLASVSSVAQAFQVSTSSTSKASLTTQLQGHKNIFWGPAASVIAGLTFAGQVATASIPGTMDFFYLTALLQSISF